MIPRAAITAWRGTAPWPDDAQVEQDPVLSRALVELFGRPAVAEQVAFRGGTALQQRVWDALRQVPPGATVGYAELAARTGRPEAARAVAGACAANGLAVAVPCHRVVRADGQLSGYRWGVERKRALLEREHPSGSVRRTHEEDAP